MQKLKLLAALIFGISLFTVASVPAYAAEDIQGNICKGAELSLSGSADDCKKKQNKCTDSKGKEISCEQSVNNLIGTIVNILSIIVGIVAVIMIVYGGFRYITSGGDSGNVTNAKNTILYAIIGLIIVALAQVIVRFVLGKTTGVTT